MLSDKLEKLLNINDKIAENDILNCQASTATIFKERNVSPKQSPKASYLHEKYAVKSPKAQVYAAERNLKFVQEMNSTWGTHSKENRFVPDF